MSSTIKRSSSDKRKRIDATRSVMIADNRQRAPTVVQ